MNKAGHCLENSLPASDHVDDIDNTSPKPNGRFPVGEDMSDADMSDTDMLYDVVCYMWEGLMRKKGFSPYESNTSNCPAKSCQPISQPTSQKGSALIVLDL